MAENTAIEWADATWNPITGCTLVSEGCRHCYAARLAAGRMRGHPSREGLARINAAGEAKFTGEVRFNEKWLDWPLRRRKPKMIFVCAHGDLFHESVPDEWIDRVFAVMALAPQHTFQVLTKRPERARAWLLKLGDEPSEWRSKRLEYARLTLWPLPNVWLGTSVEDQATADARIPHLLATPAAVRFVSAEPLLGPVDLTSVWARMPGGGESLWNALNKREAHDAGLEGDVATSLDWVIVGGESGPGARPMHPEWARSLRDQCQAAGAAYFFKQWGAWAPRRAAAATDLVNAQKALIVRPDGSVTSGLMPYGPDAWIMDLVGKKRAGRLLDGLTWDQMPEVPHG